MPFTTQELRPPLPIRGQGKAVGSPAELGGFAVGNQPFTQLAISKAHGNPKLAWKGVKADHELTIKPGPNNPVGLVWIDLTAPSYGIHGTPEPKNIGKTQSHGCIRLTNWDALDLAGMVGRGTLVKFEDEDTPVAPFSASAGATRAPKGAAINAKTR
jgi:hypothetical protein